MTLLHADPSATGPFAPDKHPAKPWSDDELDRAAELRADGERPFPVDRRVLRDVVQDRLAVRVDRVRFLSAGTFHKVFLLHLDTRLAAPPVPPTLVFRIARPSPLMHMPSLKTESEVATLAYLRTRTAVPVPTVYLYDATPYNILGAEWIVMSQAPGVPLSTCYHALPAHALRAVLAALAALLIPLFEHRFPAIGSLYLSPPAEPPPLAAAPAAPAPPHVVTGPIVSYPFFGAARGLLAPAELDRGPWPTFSAYLSACVQREIDAVVREGRRPAAAESASDSDADAAPDCYHAYRATQRSRAHSARREAAVREEMRAFRAAMAAAAADGEDAFALDCHDLRLEHVFVDPHDPARITCIIDWEATCTRPLFQAAHLPAFLQRARHHHHAPLFREEVARLGSRAARAWLALEAAGAARRWAHRVVEWDGWEEGLAPGILAAMPAAGWEGDVRGRAGDG